MNVYNNIKNIDMSDKKPDNVVFNEKNNTYDAHLKPYATSVGAPVITIEDTVAWKIRWHFITPSAIPR